MRRLRLLWLLAAPRLAGGADADVAHSRHVLDIWPDTTASSEPLHNIATLKVDAGLSLDECASLPSMLEKMVTWRCACAGDGTTPVVVDVVVIVVREALAGVSQASSSSSS